MNERSGYSCHTRSAGVATHTGALPGAEMRAQHNRTRDHGRAFRNLMDSNVGRSRQRVGLLLAVPAAGFLVRLFMIQQTKHLET